MVKEQEVVEITFNGKLTVRIPSAPPLARICWEYTGKKILHAPLPMNPELLNRTASALSSLSELATSVGERRSVPLSFRVRSAIYSRELWKPPIVWHVEITVKKRDT
jgi:hypothetical protein